MLTLCNIPSFCMSSYDLLRCTAYFLERHCVLWHFLLLQHKLECPAVRRGHVSGKPSYPSNASLMQQQQQQHNGLHSVDLQGKAGQPKQNEAMARAHLELMVS